MKNSSKLCIVAVLLSCALIASSFLMTKLFVRIKKEYEAEISVKGYAEKYVKSDVGKLNFSFSTRNIELKNAYIELERHRLIVLSFLYKKGIKKEEICVNHLNTQKVYKKDEKGKQTNTLEYYIVTQGIEVSSINVDLIKSLSVSISSLIKLGLDVNTMPPNFYLSDLGDLKLKLLAMATEDAYKRAQTLASNSGGAVGKLNSARQGVFQITTPNSTETSDYGVYDTSTIDKTAKVVVTLDYTIEEAD